jgi:putative SOS response-associated peptidase YedK
MCGRSAQTQHAAMAAAVPLGAVRMRSRGDDGGGGGGAQEENGSELPSGKASSSSSSSINLDENNPNKWQWRDNWNMSPGMDCMVFSKEDGKIKMDKKTWGLIPKHGTANNPLPEDGKGRMSLCFSNLMYNARTDTLYTKPTFARLANQGKTCLVALDGFFEWKASPLPKGKKQPYFIYRQKDGNGDSKNESQSYLLMAGLWTRVNTGRPEEPTIDSLTILTTEACQQLQWLHHRMPVCVWNWGLAKQWLENPSQKVMDTMDLAARMNNRSFGWHMVTQEMSNVKFRDKAAINAIPKPKTVTSYFVPSSKNESQSSSSKKSASASKSPAKLASKELKGDIVSATAGTKRAATSPLKESAPVEGFKRSKQTTPSKKKGTITSFFSPKK